MIDSPNDSDEFSEEVIYSQESPKVGDIITDYDWNSDRFVEFKSPFTRNEILSPGNNSSRWNKNNSSVMMIDNHQRRNEIKTQEQFPTQKVGNFIYNGVYMYMIIYIYIPLLTKEMSCKKLEILGLMLCLLLLVRN